MHSAITTPVRATIKRLSRRRQPLRAGRLYLPGLQAPVSVQRDRYGIPRITARSRHDVLFAQGFVHAQERAWQMEMQRLAAAGRVAAVMGPAGLPTDRLARTLGFARLAAATWELVSPPVQADVRAYVDGVNACLTTTPKLPVEFAVVGHTPAPWDVLDVIGFGRLQAWALSFGWAGELVRARLIQALGAEAAAALEPRYPDQHPITLPHGIDFNRLTPDGMLQAATGPFLQRVNGVGEGSNAWVIAGHKSATGSALLANDMHLPITTPALWYHVDLRCPDDAFHVAGASIPGLPYVLVGHNDHIAWGTTLAYTDCEDLFIEQFHPHDPTRYRFGDTWRRATVVEERIEVKGQPDHVERVTITHHGPIVSPILPDAPQALALSSMALCLSRNMDGFAALNRARGWDDFVSAVRLIDSPPLNQVYADRDGNIGYYLGGSVPIRAQGHGLTPAPGWTGEHEWVGTVPFEAMPHALNPPEGYIISANHKIVPDDFPYFLGAIWSNGFRAARLHELIPPAARLTTDDCRRFQMDMVSLPGKAMQAILADFATDNAAAARALALIRAWDGVLSADSSPAAVYKVFQRRLAYTIVRPHMDDALLGAVLGAGMHPLLSPLTEFYGYWTVTLLRLLREPQAPWLPPERRDAVITEALAYAVTWLQEQFGEDSAEWQWGRLHTLSAPHVLGLVPPLDAAFNNGPVPMGGDANTVCQTAVSPIKPYASSNVSVSYRYVVDMGRPNEAVAVYLPGQSGHPASPHYGDLVSLWAAGDYFPMAGDATAVHTLTLAPPP